MINRVDQRVSARMRFWLAVLIAAMGGAQYAVAQRLPFVPAIAPTKAPATAQEASNGVRAQNESPAADRGESAVGEEPGSQDEASSEDAAAVEKERLEQAKRELELLRLFADTFEQIRSNYVKDVSDRELMEAAIQGMVSKLDQFSSYIPPESLDRFKGSVESEFGGIGIQVSTETGELQVITPLVGTPAYRAGIQAGDVITEISGTSTKGLSIDKAVDLMKGPIGTEVKVRVRKPGSEEAVELALQRETIRVETILGDTRNPDDSWNFMLADNPDQVAYLRVTTFGRHTTAELESALESVKSSGAKGIVIDLRFNPGGLLSTAIEVCDLFIKEGRIVSTEGRNVEPRVWDAREPGTFPDMPMAVLVNGFSASASEIVAACLQDHQRAVIVGERTFGKGSVQNVIDLENGRSALKLTTAGYMRPSGKNIHRFSGAKDSDEWGVSPNDGFLVKLEPSELDQLIRRRRDRDIVPAKQAEPSAAQANPNGGDEPAADSNEANEADDANKNESSDDPPGENGEKGGEGENGEKKDDAEAKPFSDRQLDRALEYLHERIANDATASAPDASTPAASAPNETPATDAK